MCTCSVPQILKDIFTCRQYNIIEIKDHFYDFYFAIMSYVTLEHKTSHKGPFLEIEMFASSES